MTGVSGSGKSSLVVDTLHAESRARFTEHLSAHVRRQLGAGRGVRGDLDGAEGLRPTVALAQRRGDEYAALGRSTVATLAAIHPLLRILFSRAGLEPDGTPTERLATAFSFAHRDGACPDCGGVGSVLRVDVAKLVRDPDLPLFDGAMAATKSGASFGDPHGRHRAIVDAVGAALGFDPGLPFAQLDEAARRAVLDGCGAREFDVTWRYRRGRRSGEHVFVAAWPGLRAEIEAEHAKKAHDARGAAIAADLMSARPCPACDGERLARGPRGVRVLGRTLPEWTALRVDAALRFVEEARIDDPRVEKVWSRVAAELRARLRRLASLGLGHLGLDRGAATLSSGEIQRVRLARQVAMPLFGRTSMIPRSISFSCFVWIDFAFSIFSSLCKYAVSKVTCIFIVSSEGESSSDNRSTARRTSSLMSDSVMFLSIRNCVVFSLMIWRNADGRGSRMRL